MSAVARTLVKRVRAVLDDGNTSLGGRTVLALCSGGIDSATLVALLARLPHGAAPRTLTVLWCDHGFRADVGDDRNAARRAAESAGAAFIERRWERPRADSSEGGRQAAARAWRYGCAVDVAGAVGADVIVTGHTADDNLETMLAGIVDDGGLASLAGIPLHRAVSPGVVLVRPLLALSRAEVVELATALDVVWADDPTNDDPGAARRNVLRHDVIPRLVAAHAGSGANLARLGRAVRSQRRATVELATIVLDSIARDALTLDSRRLAGLPSAARRAVVAEWLRRAGLGRAVTERLIAAISDAVSAPGESWSLDLPGGRCVRRDGYDVGIVEQEPVIDGAGSTPTSRSSAP